MNGQTDVQHEDLSTVLPLIDVSLNARLGSAEHQILHLQYLVFTEPDIDWHRRYQ